MMKTNPTAAIAVAEIRKAPHIAETDCIADAAENEVQLTSPRLALLAVLCHPVFRKVGLDVIVIIGVTRRMRANAVHRALITRQYKSGAWQGLRLF